MRVSPTLEVCPAVAGTGRASGTRLLAESVGVDRLARLGRDVVGHCPGLPAGSCLRQACGCRLSTRRGPSPQTGLRWGFEAGRPVFGDAT